MSNTNLPKKLSKKKTPSDKTKQEFDQDEEVEESYPYPRVRLSKTKIKDDKTSHTFEEVDWDEEESELLKEKLATITLYDYSQNKEFKKWQKNFQESERGEEALINLKGISKKSTTQIFKNLKNHILVSCFLASKYDQEKEAYKEGQIILKNIEEKDVLSQIDSVKRVLGFLGKSSIEKYFSGPRSVHRTIEKGKEFYLDRLKESLPLYKLQMELLQKRIKNQKNNIKIIGPLIYIKTPPKNALAQSSTNGLILNLAYLFRHFTKSGEIPLQNPLFGRKRPIPRQGKPNYSLIQDFIEATLQVSITEQQITQRANDLLKGQNVQLSYWPHELTLPS